MKFIRILLALGLLALTVSSVFGQSQTANRSTGNLNASSSACATVNSCVALTIPPDAGGVGVQISGTFSATLQFEVSIDGTNWVSSAGTPAAGGVSVTSVTSAGTYQFSIAALVGFRVRVSSFSSGLAQVVMQAGYGSPSVNPQTATQAVNVSQAGGTSLPTLDTGQTAGLLPDQLALIDNNGGTFSSVNQISEVRDRVVSAANTQTLKVYDLRNVRDTLSIHAACSAGTAALTVESSSDNTNWIQADSIAAAQFIVKVYGATTAGAAAAAAGAGPIAPLAYRWLRLTEATCGVSNTSTLTVAAK